MNNLRTPVLRARDAIAASRERWAAKPRNQATEGVDIGLELALGLIDAEIDRADATLPRPAVRHPVKRVTVNAVFTDAAGHSETKPVLLELRERGYVWMVGGPTGSESFAPEPDHDPARGWTANAGDGRYRNCVVEADELARGLRALGVIA